MSIKLKVKKLDKDAIIPQYKHDGDSGFDLHSLKDYYVYPSEQKLIQTGLAFEIPYGYEMQIRPRSGLALKNQITLTNSPGTIDSNYRGEVGIILFNCGNDPFKIRKGDRVAQAVVQQVEYVVIDEVEELNETTRDSGGYGSTGV